MSIRNQVKGVVMKKVSLALVAVLSFIFIQPVEASQTKSLVIIDSYFDSKTGAPNVTCITLSNAACTNVVTSTTTSLSHSINHGNVMTEIAKKQNSALPITQLRSAPASARSVAEVNAGNFIDALNWVNNNSSSVGAVSVSRYFNHPNGTCKPSSTNTAVHGGVAKADAKIRSLIATLKLKNIPVFVSTGNKQGTRIDYPACITDTVSVTTGSTNSSGDIVSIHALDSNTDYAADYSVLNFSSPVFGSIPHTTSSATVAVAAQYLTLGFSSTKVVNIKP